MPGRGWLGAFKKDYEGNAGAKVGQRTISSQLGALNKDYQGNAKADEQYPASWGRKKRIMKGMLGRM